ncbi:MAG: hypothetical protein MI919_04845, partial [Holophagales bacterium]|nr:hypothetical protein [Holophagales bacterium]
MDTRRESREPASAAEERARDSEPRVEVEQPPEPEGGSSAEPAHGEPPERTWKEAVQAFFHPRVLAIFVLGFNAGIPLLLIFGTLSIWLREAGEERATVTFFSWAVLGYSFKFVWAPLLDRLPVPFLTRRFGRRRGWMLASQAMVILALILMAANDPQESLVRTAMGAVFLGFSSATQDVVIDAYRIEAVSRDLQAMMSSAYMAGYRLGMILAGAGALELAAFFGSDGAYSYTAWAKSYLAMAAAVVLAGVVTTLVIDEPVTYRAIGEDSARRPTIDYVRFLGLFALSILAFVGAFVFSKDGVLGLRAGLAVHMAEHAAGFLAETARLLLALVAAVLAAVLLIRMRLVPEGMVRESYLEPVGDFVRRFGKAGLLVLLLVGTYRISDIVLGAVANVFYVDIGFTKEQIARISKTFGVLMTITGGFLGGVLSVRLGLGRTLFLGALLAALTNLLFA